MPIDFKSIFGTFLQRAPEIASSALPDCALCENKAFPAKCIKCERFVCLHHGFFSSELQVICDDCVEDQADKETYGPWDVLGLLPGATEEEINKAFKEKSKVYHPDKGGSEILFKRLNKAKDDMLAMKGKK